MCFAFFLCKLGYSPDIEEDRGGGDYVGPAGVLSIVEVHQLQCRAGRESVTSVKSGQVELMPYPREQLAC